MNQRDEIRVDRRETIVTERCRLRYPEGSDIPHIWSASQTPNFNDGLPWGPPASMAEIDEPFQAAQERWVSGDEFSWAIESKTGRDFIGWISIRRELQDRAWSIGFWVHPAKQGQGYASECAAAVLDFGFARLKANVITARHAAWNEASGRVLRRIGMTCVRIKPKGFRKNEEWVEELEYEIRPA